MSLLTIVSRIEEERQLNRTLLNTLLEKLDADIARMQEQKAALVEEFEERDASLSRLIDGETPKPATLAVAAPVSEHEATDAEAA